MNTLEQWKKEKYPFEEYLKFIHGGAYPALLDDDMPDHFDDWLGSLDGEDYIAHGNDFSKFLLDLTK